MKEILPYKCLDKGYVRLVDHMGSDLSIVRSARVSYNAEWRTGENEKNDEKLIKFLYKNKHMTPFESVVFTFEVKAPIFVFRQWHRHRTQSYNEVSARYTELEDEFYVPDSYVIGEQSVDNKQARVFNGNSERAVAKQLEIDAYLQLCTDCFSQYHTLLKLGWPRELARMVLPLSTYSKMFTSLNLRNLFHFLELRLHPHAQYEIRVYAEAMLDIASQVVPVATQAFKDGMKNETP